MCYINKTEEFNNFQSFSMGKYIQNSKLELCNICLPQAVRREFSSTQSMSLSGTLLILLIRARDPSPPRGKPQILLLKLPQGS